MVLGELISEGNMVNVAFGSDTRFLMVRAKKAARGQILVCGMGWSVV